jgi:hypothetical protein
MLTVTTIEFPAATFTGWAVKGNFAAGPIVTVTGFTLAHPAMKARAPNIKGPSS